MKIVFTVASYFPSKNGVQYVTQYHAEGLAANGNQVTVITSISGNTSKIEYYKGVKILRVNAYNAHIMHRGSKKEFLDIVKQEVENSDVLINVCLQSYSADWILPIIKEIKIKKILYMHGMHSFKWNKTDFSNPHTILLKIIRNLWWYPFYTTNWEKIMNYDAAIHLHEKDDAYKYFIDHGYKNNYVLYNAVENTFFEKVNKKKQIINVGSFNNRKNQLKAIELFYKSKLSDYSMVFVGNPQNEYYFKLLSLKDKLDREYGKRDVKIYCNESRSKTIDLIKESRVYLLTSKWEAFPISLVEAMASKMCYISSDVGIISYLPGGIICSTDDDFINALNSIDDLYDNLAKQAYVFADLNFRQSEQTKRLEEIIKKLV